MSKTINHISILSILSKLTKDYKTINFNEDDVIDNVGEALEAIGSRSILEETTAFLEVKNKSCRIPFATKNIIAVAKSLIHNKLNCEEEEQNNLCTKEIVSAIEDNDEKESVLDYVVLDCNGTPIHDYNIAYYRPFFDVKCHFNDWWLNPYRRSNFVPVIPSTHDFFDSLICEFDYGLYDRYDNYSNSCVDYEYKVKGDYLIFNFDEGVVAISYNRIKLDSEGYPMIPDTYENISAVTWYCVYKYFEGKWFDGDNSSEARMLKAESNFQYYVRMAKSANKMLYADENEVFKRTNNYLLPKDNYKTFFGNYNKNEIRSWNTYNIR